MLAFLKASWMIWIPAIVLIIGAIYRKVTRQPFQGNIPPVGVLNDMPDSVFPGSSDLEFTAAAVAGSSAGRSPDDPQDPDSQADAAPAHDMDALEEADD